MVELTSHPEGSTIPRLEDKLAWITAARLSVFGTLQIDVLNVPDFLEELVCYLLSVKKRPERENEGWDFESKDGYLVEVKSSKYFPYLDSKDNKAPGFQFSNLQGYEGKGKVKADLFVFIGYKPRRDEFSAALVSEDFWCFVCPKFAVRKSTRIMIPAVPDSKGKRKHWKFKVPLNKLEFVVRRCGEYQRASSERPESEQQENLKTYLAELAKLR